MQAVATIPESTDKQTDTLLELFHLIWGLEIHSENTDEAYTALIYHRSSTDQSESYRPISFVNVYSVKRQLQRVSKVTSGDGKRGSISYNLSADLSVLNESLSARGENRQMTSKAWFLYCVRENF